MPIDGNHKRLEAYPRASYPKPTVFDDDRTTVAAIIERGALTRRSNADMKEAIRSVGLDIVGGEVVPISEEPTARIDPKPFAGTLETAPAQTNISARVVLDPVAQGI